jgi:hypothetical protein
LCGGTLDDELAELFGPMHSLRHKYQTYVGIDIRDNAVHILDNYGILLMVDWFILADPSLHHRNMPTPLAINESEGQIIQ